MYLCVSTRGTLQRDRTCMIVNIHKNEQCHITCRLDLCTRFQGDSLAVLHVCETSRPTVRRSSIRCRPHMLALLTSHRQIPVATLLLRYLPCRISLHGPMIQLSCVLGLLSERNLEGIGVGARFHVGKLSYTCCLATVFQPLSQTRTVTDTIPWATNIVSGSWSGISSGSLSWF